MELATEHLAPPDVHFVPPMASDLLLTAFDGSLCLYTCPWFGIIPARERERDRESEREDRE